MLTIILCDCLMAFEIIIRQYLVIPVVDMTLPFTPNAIYIVQSIDNYIDATILYVQSFTLVVLSWDRYYGICRPLCNPFDRLSSRTIYVCICTVSLILSVPFVVTSYVYYFDYQSKTLVCLDNSEQYMPVLNQNMVFKQSTRLFRLFMEFIIPALLVTYFTLRIIIHLYSIGDHSWRPVAKRLLAVLAVFIVKNTAFHTATKFSYYQPGDTCPLSAQYYVCFMIIRATGFANSLIFFWFATGFKKNCLHFIVNCVRVYDKNIPVPEARFSRKGTGVQRVHRAMSEDDSYEMMKYILFHRGLRKQYKPDMDALQVLILYISYPLPIH
ncbi:unnamed protein product [Oppiella nova]|uniref:G-protein coupled receptors family 1 profile domain-containing protein n=1 Tax=Oppiella nova TaxID=334625 RepID=A0A7R9M7K9_9ACAR|nr:unnamed protein product [Oppiella nova]CAG2172285.1 unnamed protein product [Oppiella nova]